MIPFLSQSLVEISLGHLKQVRPNKELCLETVLFHKYEEPIQKYNNTTQTKKLKDNNWGIVASQIQIHKSQPACPSSCPLLHQKLLLKHLKTEVGQEKYIQQIRTRNIWEIQIRKIWEMRWKNNNFFPWEQHWLLVIIHSRLHCPDQASFIAIALIDQDLCWLFTYAQFIQNQFNTNEQSIPNAHSPFIVNAFQCIVDWSVKSFNLLYLNSGSSIKLAFFLVNSILCRLM